jgi:hypothetical protein
MMKLIDFRILSSTLNADVALTDVYVDVNPLGKVKSHKKGNEVQQRHAEPEVNFFSSVLQVFKLVFLNYTPENVLAYNVMHLVIRLDNQANGCFLDTSNNR